MAQKWTDVIKDPRVQGLAPEQKQQLAQRYFDNVVAKDQRYLQADDTTKKALSDRFWNTAQGSVSMVKPEPVSVLPDGSPKQIMGEDVPAPTQEEISENKWMQEKAGFEKTDPKWYTLENPKVLGAMSNEGLVRMMKSEDSGKEVLGRVEKASRRILGMDSDNITTGVRDKAYQELLKRGYSRNDVISALNGESPTFAGQLVKDTPEMLGSLALSVPAAIATKGNIPATVAAGAAGGALGKGAQMFVRTATNDVRAPQTNAEVVKGLSKAALTQGATELAGGLGGKILGKVAAPFASKILPDAVEASAQLTKRGAHLTPAQMTESRLLDTVENMSEHALVGGGKLSDFKRLIQPQAYRKYVDDVAERFVGSSGSLSPEQAGELLLDTLTGNKEAFKSQAGKLYKVVDELTDGMRVSLADIKKAAQQRIDIAAARKNIGGSEAGDTLLSKISQLDDEISWAQAADLRSAFMDELNSLQFSRDKAAGLAKQFVGLTDSAMEKSAQRLNPQALIAWRSANEFYKTGMEKFNSKLIRSLSKRLIDNPEVAVRSVFVPNASKQLRYVKEAIGDKAFKDLRSQWLKTTMENASDFEGNMLGAKFLKDFNKLGDSTLKEVFSPDEIGAIRLLGRTGQLVQTKSTGGGSILIQLTQPGAILNLVSGTGYLKGTSAVISIGPALMSRLMTNPRTAKMLTVGMKVPANSSRGLAIGAKLAEEARRYQGELEQQRRTED
jgi:hypothetical protein